MDDFADQYRRRLIARIETLESACRSLSSEPVEAVATLRRVAHILRGSGATFGFPEISARAAAAEEAPDDAIGSAASRLLEVLRQVVAGGPTTAQPLVLIVDDDREVSALLASALKSDRWMTREVGTVHGAEDVLKNEVVALVILDLVLPDEDGRRLLKRLRRDPRTAKVPILVVSANLGEAIKTECFELGADGFFEKPLDPGLVRKAVAARLELSTVPVPALAPSSTGLPHRLEGTAGTAAVTAPLRQKAALRVLLAEDDDVVAALIMHRLGRDGFAVKHYADGRQALAAAQQETAHLAILDLKLPGIDGFTLLSSLRALPGWARTPVLILTSLGSEKDLTRGFALGANDYVTKPFSPAELVARVKRLVLQ